MARERKDDPGKNRRAAELIDAFAVQLSKLVGGKPIPKRWKSRLQKALEAVEAPGRRPGNQFDSERYKLVVKDLLLADATVSLADIAKRRRISLRQVERYRDEIEAYLGDERLGEELGRIDAKSKARQLDNHGVGRLVRKAMTDFRKRRRTPETLDDDRKNLINDAWTAALGDSLADDIDDQMDDLLRQELRKQGKKKALARLKRTPGIARRLK